MAKKRVVPLSQVGDEMEKMLDEYYQLLLKEVSEDLVNNTPGESGHLKGSTRLSANTPLYESGPTDKGGSSTKAQMKSEADGFSINDKAYLTNGAEYAVYVEKGTDTVKPYGFMRKTMESANAQSKRAIGKIK
jgi:hypothetical protein